MKENADDDEDDVEYVSDGEPDANEEEDPEAESFVAVQRRAAALASAKLPLERVAVSADDTC